MMIENEDFKEDTKGKGDQWDGDIDEDEEIFDRVWAKVTGQPQVEQQQEDE